MSASLLKWIGLVAFALGTLGATRLMTARQGGLCRLWVRYVGWLDGAPPDALLGVEGRTIALVQLGALVLIAAVGAAFGAADWCGPAALVVGLGPTARIWMTRRRRRQEIEKQLNGFALSLANALRTTPSLGDAFLSIVDLTVPPLRDELAYSVKAMRLGAALDQALLLTSTRLRSENFDMIISSVLIGRNVGGDLASILESTAESLREMRALQDLILTKTAEGRTQIWVLAMFPLVLVFGLHSLMTNYFDAFTHSIAGYILVILAIGLWASAIFVARRVMSIDV